MIFEVDRFIEEMREHWTRFDGELLDEESPEIHLVESAGVFRVEGTPLAITIVLQNGEYVVADVEVLEKAIARFHSYTRS